MALRAGVVGVVTAAMSGCITVGPMPGATFTTSTPDSRAQLEVSASIAPGFYVSDAVIPLDEERPAYGTALPQLSGFIDPGEWLGGLGISVGARGVGGAGGYLEPMIRYRRSFGEDRRFGLALVAGGAYGEYADEARPPASMTLLKGTLEAAGDLRITPPSWIELHAIGGASLLVLSANGQWCADMNTGIAGNCPESGATTPKLIGTASAMGAFPAGYAGLAVDLGRSWTGVFHLVRLSGVVAGGSVPQVAPLTPTTVSTDTQVTAQAAPRAWWAMWGVALTVAFGQGAARAEEDASVRAEAAPVTPVVTRTPGMIRGRITDGTRGIAGATVRSRSGATATTDPDGRFELADAGPGVVELEVAAAGYRAAKEAVQVPSGGDAELSVMMERATLPPLAIVRGEVRGKGQPVANVLVEVDGAQAHARTGEDGRFELRVPEGRYQLRFAANRFVSQAKAIQVEKGQQALFYVELAPTPEP